MLAVDALPLQEMAPEPLAPEATVELLNQARSGDASALERLLDRCLPPLRRWAHGRLPAPLRGPQETADLVQNAIKATLDRLDTFEVRHQGALQAYLRTAVLEPDPRSGAAAAAAAADDRAPRDDRESGPLAVGAGHRGREPQIATRRRWIVCRRPIRKRSSAGSSSSTPTRSSPSCSASRVPTRRAWPSRGRSSAWPRRCAVAADDVLARAIDGIADGAVVNWHGAARPGAVRRRACRAQVAAGARRARQRAPVGARGDRRRPQRDDARGDGRRDRRGA